LFEQREREYLLAKVRVKARLSVENVDAGDYRIDSLTEGQATDLPRWMAEELAVLNVVEIPEEPFETEIFRALSKEKMMGPLQLSVLPEDFYMRMRRRLARLDVAAREGKARKEEVEKLRAVCYDLVGIRLSKLLSLSSTSTRASDMGDKLTSEEKAFFTKAQLSANEWKTALMGSGK
jgi:GINS complex protein